MPKRQLAQRLEQCMPGLRAELGLSDVDLTVMAGDVPLVEVGLGDSRPPIYVTDADSQLLCVCYLWRNADVIPAQRSALMETLLELNPSVPLSSFAKIGDHFVLIGALSRDATTIDLVLELATLSDNAVDALATLADYLHEAN